MWYTHVIEEPPPLGRLFTSGGSLSWERCAYAQSVAVPLTVQPLQCRTPPALPSLSQ